MKAELEVGVNAMHLAPQVAISRALSTLSQDVLTILHNDNCGDQFTHLHCKVVCCVANTSLCMPKF
jgi:hypothetical protein